MKTLSKAMAVVAALTLGAPVMAQRPETTGEILARLAELEREVSRHLVMHHGAKEGKGDDRVSARQKRARTWGEKRKDSLRARRLQLAAALEQNSDATELLADTWHDTFGRDVPECECK